MKNKNPLYVVKEDSKVVEEAKNIFELFVKRFNLEPVIQILKQILDFLLLQIHNYPTLVQIKKIIDEIVGKLELFSKFGIA
jgi:hypothetical protein